MNGGLSLLQMHDENPTDSGIVGNLLLGEPMLFSLGSDELPKNGCGINFCWVHDCIYLYSIEYKQSGGS